MQSGHRTVQTYKLEMENTQSDSDNQPINGMNMQGIDKPVLEMLIQDNCNLAILKINGQWRLDLRCVDIYEGKIRFLKKGICLTLDQVHALLQVFIHVDEAMINHVDTRLLHVKKNVFVNVSSKYKGVNIRQYFESEDGLAPTKRGFFF